MVSKVRSYRRSIHFMFIILLLFGSFPGIGFAKATAASEQPLVRNHSFENDLDSWETNGSSAITTPESAWLPENGGKKLLNYWAEGAYIADTYQIITGLENGEYTLSAWVAADGSFQEKYMYAKDAGSNEVTVEIPATSGGWTRIETAVAVENGQVSIGFYADAHAGAWLGVDVVMLVKNGDPSSPPVPEREDFIYGVDISTLTKVEDYGGKFYDQGVEKDAIDILTSYGSNYARLKIWKDPVDVYANGKAYNDLQDTINKAVRIKEADMKFLLNFHYSGFWADPGRQDKPASWTDLSFEELVQAVYDHTEDTIEVLKAEGAAPDMVQVGNEITPGMLFPDGRIDNNDFSKLAELLNAGIRAVRDTLGDDVPIMLHLDRGGNNSLYRWWFDGIISAGVTDFQIIGASYYPYWHGTLADLESNLNDISQRYQRDVIVVETAYGFTLDDADGHQNIFTEYEEDVAGYPATVEGQAKFLYDLLEVVRNVPDNRGLGFFYWEPAWLGVEGAGWRAGEGNAWENQAMFDLDGHALESLNIFTPGHVPPEPEPREREEKEEDPTLEGLTLHSLNKPATASSSAGSGGGKSNAPENAVEDNDHTSWGTDEGAGAWWKVDLEEKLPLERMLFHFWDGVKQVKIELSDDDEVYTTLDTYDVLSPKTDLTLPEGTAARYVRVTITEVSSNWVGFMYFKAYGSEKLPEPGEDGEDHEERPQTITVNLGETVEVYANAIVSINGTRSTVTLPADLPEGTLLTVNGVNPSRLDASKLLSAGDAFEFVFTYPAGAENYSGDFTLALAYNTDTYSADKVNIYYFDESNEEWLLCQGTAANGVITLGVSHFSTYGVFAELSGQPEPEAGNGGSEPGSNSGNNNHSGTGGTNGGSGDGTGAGSGDSDSTQESGDGEVENGTSSGENGGEDPTATETAEEQLPDTATSMYNLLLTGFMLLTIGITVIYVNKRRSITA
ncbi:arabinogalactan endo-1,4-beta-galactosidase [Evansella caseinilytica]|uniref:Arabinogalactan endo-beta-1,4-galactanase n=1 Tax=Evansella caseinilytica TaxID=1503961 RepID=A0A1H3TS28_9BACI|nr:glycosyl hydrolase 53 family protein [Evansella caseinilytica]SDZ52129.1 arabinogalactan endo-1,4-beta-galactosidase [Evansella caseinilytica]